MSTDKPMGPALKSRADELSDRLRLVRDALSLDLGDGVDVVEGARVCREERDRLHFEVLRVLADWRRYADVVRAEIARGLRPASDGTVIAAVEQCAIELEDVIGRAE